LEVPVFEMNPKRTLRSAPFFDRSHWNPEPQRYLRAKAPFRPQVASGIEGESGRHGFGTMCSRSPGRPACVSPPLKGVLLSLSRCLFAAGMLLGLLVSPASAQDAAAVVGVSNAWARATASGQKVGGAYLTLKAGSRPDRLIGASAAVAERVELHSMSMDGDVMRMRQVEAIEVPAGQQVELKPGGLHLMLMGLRQSLPAGSRFPVKLRFERAGEVTVEMKVQAVGEAAGGGTTHHH
jgi:copper(I)-binding protein